MKNFQALFLISLTVLAISACSKNESKKDSPTPDIGAEVLSAVSGTSFQTGYTSLSFSKSGHFELTLDSDVRYFPSENDPSIRESDARCLVKMLGTSSFTQGSDRSSPSVAAYVDMSLDDVILISSSINRPDLVSVPAKEICEKYVASLHEKKTFVQYLNDYGSNFMNFINLSFDIPYSTAPSSAYLFNSSAHTSSHSDGYNVRRANAELVYLVKPDTQVDVKSATLADLKGTYVLAPYSGRTELELIISENQSNMHLSSRLCGFTYQITLEAAYFDTQALKAKLTPVEMKEFSGIPNGSMTLECDTTRKTIASIGDAPIRLRYINHAFGSEKEFNYLVFALPTDPETTPSLRFQSK